MKNRFFNLQLNGNESKKENNNSLGSLIYPAVDDLYHKFYKEKDINHEVVSKHKELNKQDKIKAEHEKYLLDEMCGNYLDAPAGELDDEY